jgi:hypothetical protein
MSVVMLRAMPISQNRDMGHTAFLSVDTFRERLDLDGLVNEMGSDL